MTLWQEVVTSGKAVPVSLVAGKWIYWFVTLMRWLTLTVVMCSGSL